MLYLTLFWYRLKVVKRREARAAPFIRNMDILTQLGGWDAYGIDLWVPAHFTSFYASSDTTLMLFEGREENGGTRWPVHSQYGHIYSVGGMRCMWHKYVSSGSFHMFLCFILHYSDAVWRLRRDERHVLPHSFATCKLDLFTQIFRQPSHAPVRVFHTRQTRRNPYPYPSKPVPLWRVEGLSG
jgi:hypothetical protein